MIITNLSTSFYIVVLYLLKTIICRAETCEDVSGTFDVNYGKSNGKTWMRNCKQIRRKYPHLCNISSVVQQNCPLSCGQCGNMGNWPSCYDVTESFTVGSKTRSCANAVSNSNLCKKSTVKKNCPVSCGICEKTFTNCPYPDSYDSYSYSYSDGSTGLCCNGLATNCNLRVDEMLFATMHNANHSNEYSPFANHKAPLEDALEVGYRAFFLDICKCNNDDDDDLEVVFCHAYCSIGRRDPSVVFTNIVSWLENNPMEVIIFNFEMSHGDPLPTELWSFMSSVSGMADRVYEHDGGDWPTMGSLIESGKQIIAFQHNGPQCPGSTGCSSNIPEFFDYTMETDWDYDTVDEVELLPDSCYPTRGGSGARNFYSVNNFVTGRYGPSYKAALVLNEKNFVEQRLYHCNKIMYAMPNFINVDYWQQGHVPEAVQEVNLYRGERKQMSERRKT